jgi:hypothetical protein
VSVIAFLIISFGLAKEEEKPSREEEIYGGTHKARSQRLASRHPHPNNKQDGKHYDGAAKRSCRIGSLRFAVHVLERFLFPGSNPNCASQTAHRHQKSYAEKAWRQMPLSVLIRNKERQECERSQDEEQAAQP